MRYHRIPDETIRRLPVYLRGVFALAEEGHQTVSSQHLSSFLGINPWQIRKDFSYFGDFGIPGVGYEVGILHKRIRKILYLDSRHDAVLVGVGNLGSAVLAYQGFGAYGLKIVAAYDCDRKKIGKTVNGIPISDMSEIGRLKRRGVDLGIITVPRDAAQSVAEQLVQAGIRGILSFSSQRLILPRKIKVIDIDIAMDLARLPYYMSAG